MLGRFFIHLLRSLKSEKEDVNPISEYFFNNRGRLIHKWHHYFEIYHRHFARFRGRSPVIVEIGVFHGGSLQMWRNYFGPGARTIGIDIDPRCRRLPARGDVSGVQQGARRPALWLAFTGAEPADRGRHDADHVCAPFLRQRSRHGEAPDEAPAEHHDRHTFLLTFAPCSPAFSSSSRTTRSRFRSRNG